MKNKDIIKELLNVNMENIKEETIIINNNKPFFIKEDYNIEEGEPEYFEPDEYGRSTGAIALISKNTIPLIINKKLKYPNPYGWSKELENKDVFERCHIIAYSLSAKLADKRNIFIGTEHLNTSVMIKFENRIKNYIQNNNIKMLYRVTVKYKDTNRIPTGIVIEAKSLDDDFEICQFCYNCQKGVKFRYSDGIIIKDTRILNKAKRLITKKRKPNNDKNESNSNYLINRRTNEFHLYDNNCDKLKNIDVKYIQETTTTKKDLINANLKPCNKCIIV